MFEYRYTQLSETAVSTRIALTGPSVEEDRRDDLVVPADVVEAEAQRGVVAPDEPEPAREGLARGVRRRGHLGESHPVHDRDGLAAAAPVKVDDVDGDLVGLASGLRRGGREGAGGQRRLRPSPALVPAAAAPAPRA